MSTKTTFRAICPWTGQVATRKSARDYTHALAIKTDTNGIGVVSFHASAEHAEKAGRAMMSRYSSLGLYCAYKVVLVEFVAPATCVAQLSKQLGQALLGALAMHNSPTEQTVKQAILEAAYDLSDRFGPGLGLASPVSALEIASIIQNRVRPVTDKMERDSGKLACTIAHLSSEAEQAAHYSNQRESELCSYLQFIADQSCEERAEGSSEECPCTETGACVTEYCLPCYARASLRAVGVKRCPTCNWPMAENREDGCVPGDCSYRPNP